MATGRPAHGTPHPASPPPAALTPLAWRLLLVFALVGLGASGISAYVHYHLLRNPGYLSFCDISTTVNCTDVYLSRFGTFQGVPVAVLGAVWFVFVTLLLAAAIKGPQAFRESVGGYIFALSTLALAAVLYLGYASFFILKTVCILCLTTYVAVIGLFLVSGAVTTYPMRSLPGRVARDVRTLVRSPAALAFTAIFIIGAVLTIRTFSHEPAQAQAAAEAAPITEDVRSEFERWYESLPTVQLPAGGDGAKVVVVKFNDYQCPPCRQSFLDYKAVLEKYRHQYPGVVKFVTKDFPLERECHTGIGRDLHPAACEAAVAVRLARRRNQADRLEDWLFENQPSLTPDAVRNAARDVAGVTTMDAEYKSVLQQVEADITLGKQLGVNSTPTFFINGKRIPSGALPPQLFDAAIAYELKKAR
jgi:uncharacterized membrane protein/protein-disulfide isomerase